LILSVPPFFLSSLLFSDSEADYLLFLYLQKIMRSSYPHLHLLSSSSPPSLLSSDDKELDDALNPLALLPFPFIYHSKCRKPFSDPFFINAIPSTWFAPEREEGSGLFGLEVACDRDAFPDAWPFDSIPIPEEAGGLVKKVSEGWKDTKDWKDEEEIRDQLEFMRPGWKLSESFCFRFIPRRIETL